MSDDSDSGSIFEERSPTKPNPWLELKTRAPESKIQPTIKCVLRYFEESRPSDRMKEEALPWPFRSDSRHASRIHYHDFRGHGEPPEDVGYIGDVYLDVSSDPKCAWVCKGTAEKWRHAKWVQWGPTPLGSRSLELAEYPLLNDRFMWFKKTGGIAWYCRSHLVTLLENPIDGLHNPIGSIELMLKSETKSRGGRQYGTITSSGSGRRTRATSPITEEESDGTSDASDSDHSSAAASQGMSHKKLISRLGLAVDEAEHKARHHKRKYDEMKKENRGLRSENSQLKEKIRKFEALADMKAQKINRLSEQALARVKDLVKDIEEIHD